MLNEEMGFINYAKSFGLNSINKSDDELRLQAENALQTIKSKIKNKLSDAGVKYKDINVLLYNSIGGDVGVFLDHMFYGKYNIFEDKLTKCRDILRSKEEKTMDRFDIVFNEICMLREMEKDIKSEFINSLEDEDLKNVLGYILKFAPEKRRSYRISPDKLSMVGVSKLEHHGFDVYPLYTSNDELYGYDVSIF